MKGNFVAKHMNAINRSSVHKNLRKEYLEDHKTHIEEGLRGCTAETLYFDDAWHDPIGFPSKSNEDCSEITEEQLKDFAEFTKDLMRKYPVKFITATYIDRKKENDL